MTLSVPRAVRGALLAVATALATTAGLLGGASAAQAASGYGRCPWGEVCVFSGPVGTGDMKIVKSSLARLGTWDNRISSLSNNSDYTVCVSPDPDYGWNGATHYYNTLVSFDESSRPDLDDAISSIQLLPDAEDCGTFATHPWWWWDEEPQTRPAPTAAETAFGDLDGDGRTDLLGRNRYGALWSVNAAEDNKTHRIGTGWNAMTQLLRHGDYDTDAKEDVFARDKDGALWFYPGTGSALGTRVGLGGGWNAMRDLAAMGDLTGDGKRDLLARDTAGVLWLYPGNGKGGFGTRKNLGGGWGVMNELVGAGDMNSDRISDLVARDTSGRLWFYPGNGRGAFGARSLIGTGGWNGFKELAGIGDYDGDGRPDLLTHSHGDNYLRLYPGTGAKDGHLGGAKVIGSASDAHLVF
ncbi:FG-GAP-like repeat-containing protein [Streptomyces sp. NPDC006450]|uniref:FG-GAP-like repeat-containing protein n=1 Tax=Streptomyces sp. NPDC006450 TaxID=3155458 RepID=UPI0033B83BB6